MATFSIYIATPTYVPGASTDPVSERLLSFASLRQGWDYGRGNRIGFEVVNFGLAILANFRMFGSSQAEVFPRLSGGVLISGYKGNICVNAFVSPKLDIELVVDVQDEEVFSQEHLSLSDLIRMLGEKQWLGDASSGLLTPNTTLVWSSNVSSQQLSKIQKTTAYLWSCNHVSMQEHWGPVPTHVGFTHQKSPGTPLFFGDSKKKYYRMSA